MFFHNPLKMVQSNQEIASKSIKYMLLSVTAIFVITSAFIISVGTTIYPIYHVLSYFLVDELFSPATFTIVIGVIMLFVALFGCIGALKECTCLVNIVISILMIVLGISVFSHYQSFSSFYSNSSRFFTNFEMRDILGMVLLIVTLFGLLGSWKQNICMMNLYALFLTLILIIKLVVVLTFTMNQKTLGQFIYVPVFLYGDVPEVQHVLDQLQIKLNCCGSRSYKDYDFIDIPYNSSVVYSEDVSSGSLTLVLPQSCCTRSSEGICSNIRTSGCKSVLIELVMQNADVLRVLGVSVMFVQLLGIIFVLLLARCIRKLKALQLWTIKEQMILAQLMEDSHKNENSSVFIKTTYSSTA